MTDDRQATDFGSQFVGYTVSRCVVDFAFTLDLMRDRQLASLRIEAPFECNLKGTLLRCDPARNREALGPILTLFQRTVKSVWLSEDDSLHIAFDDEATLRVPRDPDFESWSLNGPKGELVVAGPGSRLSIFAPPGKPG